METPSIPPRNRLTRHTALLAVAGGILTTVMIQALRGSYLPTTLFILAGVLLPVPAAHLLVRLSRWRVPYPGTVTVFIIVGVLTIIAFAGKFADREALFAGAFGTAPPSDVVLSSGRHGWYDGRISVLHFQAPDDTIRSLIPAGAEVDRPLLPPYFTEGATAAEVAQQTEGAWMMATNFGWIIDPTLRRFPGWKAPARARWKQATTPQNVLLTWDGETGAAVIVLFDDGF